MGFNPYDYDDEDYAFTSPFEIARLKANALNAPIVYRHGYRSLAELADKCESVGGPTEFEWPGHKGTPPGELLNLARHGWREHEAEAMDVSARAVRMVETIVEQNVPQYAVAGADVDMGRYFSGEPECMIDYPLRNVSAVGSVVTMIADVGTTWLVSDKHILNRGLVIAGLAMALNRLGHGTDLWLSQELWCAQRPNERLILRTQVKSPNDFIDPARILFAYAHPGVQRGLGFAVARSERSITPRNPTPYGDALARNRMGYVTGMTRDMPAGTIYLNPLDRNTDAPNADAEIRFYLQQLGLLPWEDE